MWKPWAPTCGAARGVVCRRTCLARRGASRLTHAQPHPRLKVSQRTKAFQIASVFCERRPWRVMGVADGGGGRSGLRPWWAKRLAALACEGAGGLGGRSGLARSFSPRAREKCFGVSDGDDLEEWET